MTIAEKRLEILKVLQESTTGATRGELNDEITFENSQQGSNALYVLKNMKQIDHKNGKYVITALGRTALAAGATQTPRLVQPMGADDSAPPKADKKKPAATSSSKVEKKTAQKRAAEPAGHELVPLSPSRPPVTLPNGGTRAIRTADGGVIVLEGGFLVSELSGPQLAAIATTLGG